MNTALVLKAAGIGLLVSVMYQVLAKSGREEQGMLVSLAGVIIILLMLVGELSDLIGSIRTVFGI